MGQTKKIVVIGNGMVGHHFVEQMLGSDISSWEITVFGEEPRPVYDRVHLTSYFDSENPDSLAMSSRDWYRDHDVSLYLKDKIEVIDRKKKVVVSSSGIVQDYDYLVIASGSYPFVPPIDGKDRPHCFVYRTIEDLEDIAKAARTESIKVGTVVGGGLLGLEAAKALHDLGLKTHVVEFAPRLMAVQIDEAGGLLLRKKIEDLGVEVHTSAQTQSIERGEGTFHRMNFADGKVLGTDIIVFSAGIRPRDELAQAAELEIGLRGGIVIDQFCCTSDPAIFAIGECAVFKGQTYGLVAPGYKMARVAANQLVRLDQNISHDGVKPDLDDEAGAGSESFSGFDMSTKLKLMGVEVASVGDAHGTTAGARSWCYQDGIKDIYKKIVISEDRKHLLGAVLIGDALEYHQLLQMILNKMPLPSDPESIVIPQGDGGQMKIGVEALPEEAQVCSCNDVSKKKICQAVSEGSHTLSAIKACTKAGTTCGGCNSLVSDIINYKLDELGLDVNNDLCEHFQWSRQELYHLVRVNRIETFENLIAQHGKGAGCEICKPTVASILASCWNKPILGGKRRNLQDTNDIYLANMQKNGTYSIVPRVPGGEITPDKLIVIGEVAKRYQLYTKITGGQRIDLFGATVDQLPEIWRILIDAGFESGHAYGKAMRTVKSCVGSTWCRYGVQNSTGLAIKVEKRYRGLRAPHKIKLAVSGCTRECAEAQSKDAGIIATEKGWNLYVCGNGGMRPRHADLLASDLDEVTLIKYIDRFFMFYIRTGDRLQRTSVWLENLEGGIDYLRQVVCEDKLNIAHELEEEMAHIVDTYECEWQVAVNDEEQLKQFRRFVNSDAPDPSVGFEMERQQIRPASFPVMESSDGAAGVARTLS